MKNLITLLSVLLFYSSQLLAQPIIGSVQTANGEGVKDVKVTILDDENTTISVADILNGASPDFIGMKMGDVNGSAIPNAMVNGEILKKEVEQIREGLRFLLYFFHGK